jgi:hypothetical protein
MIVIELKNVPHTFTLKDGSTFRLYAREEREIKDEEVTKEMLEEQKMGDITLLKEKPVAPTPTTKATKPIAKEPVKETEIEANKN